MWLVGRGDHENVIHSGYGRAPVGLRARGAGPGNAALRQVLRGTRRRQLDASLSEQFFGPEISQHTGNDIGYRLRLGVQASRYFAAEIGFIDFGEFALRDIPYACAPQQPGPCTYDINSATQGPFANIVVSWPFAQRWALNGRVGGYYADITTSERDPDVPGTEQEYHDSGIGFSIGAGLSFQINPRMKISADWGKYDLIEFAPTLSGGIGAYDVDSEQITLATNKLAAKLPASWAPTRGTIAGTWNVGPGWTRHNNNQQAPPPKRKAARNPRPATRRGASRLRVASAAVIRKRRQLWPNASALACS
jgi:hypothetical protein